MLAGNATATITPRYYVQDSLLMMIDGEYNSTNSVGEWVHDATTKKWIDLSGNGYDYTLNSNGSWEENCLYYTKYVAQCAKRLPYYRTQEVTCSVISGRFVFLGSVMASSATSATAFRALQGLVTVSGYTNRFQTSFYTVDEGAAWIGGAASLESATPMTLTSVYAASFVTGSTAGYANGGISTLTGYNDWNSVPEKSIIGARRTDHNNYSQGRLYSVRIYTRELTEEEINRNALVDAVRFRGEAPPEAIEPSVTGSALPGAGAGSALVGCAVSSRGWLAKAISSARVEYSSSGSFDGAASFLLGTNIVSGAQGLIDGLDSGVTYQARIVVTNDLGAAGVSEVFSFTPGAPSAVTDAVEIESIVPGDYYVDITGRLKSSASRDVTFFIGLGKKHDFEAASRAQSLSPGAEFTVRLSGLSPETSYVLVPKIGDSTATATFPFVTKPSADYVRRGRSIGLTYNPADKTHVTLDFDAPGKPSSVYVLADDIDRGVGEWAYKAKVADIAADQTSAVVALPAGWGERYFALRYYIGEENSPLLAASQRYSADEGVNLVNHWDAIDNVDVDKYDASPSQWSDLCGLHSLFNASTYTVYGGVTNVYTPKSSYMSGAIPNARHGVEFGSFTLEMFVRPDKFVVQGGFFTLSGTGDRALTLDMRNTEGQIAIQYRAGGDWQNTPTAPGTPIKMAEYQHIAAVCSNSVAYLYHNGEYLHQNEAGTTILKNPNVMIGKYSSGGLCRLRICAIRFWDKPVSPSFLAANNAYDRFRFLGEGDYAPSVFAMSEVAYHFVKSSAPSLGAVSVSGLESGDDITLSASFSGNVDSARVEWYNEGSTITNTVACSLSASSLTADLFPCKGGVETFYRVIVSGSGLDDVVEGSFVSFGKVGVDVSAPDLDSATVTYKVKVTDQGAGDTWVWVKRGNSATDIDEDIGEKVRIESGNMSEISVSGLSETFGESRYFAVAVSNSCTDASNGIWVSHYGVASRTVLDEASYTLKKSGAWTDPSAWTMTGTGSGYPNANATFRIGSNGYVLGIDGQRTCGAGTFSSRTLTITGTVENASLTCDISGTGNGLYDTHVTLKNVSLIEENGISMYGGKRSGDNSWTLLYGSTFKSGGGLNMQSASTAYPVTINISDTSLLQLVNFKCFGAGVHNFNFYGTAPRLRASGLGELSTTDIHTGTINLRYTIPAELSAAGYAETPILLSGDSVFAAFSANENEEPVKVIIDPGSTVLKSHCPKTEFKLIESFGGIDTNRIALAQNIGHVELEWEYGYGWSEETGSSLGLSVPESTEDGGEEALPTLLKVRFYRHGLIFKVR